MKKFVLVLISISCLLLFTLSVSALEYDYGEYLGQAVAGSESAEDGEAVVVDIKDFSRDRYIRLVVTEGKVNRCSYDIMDKEGNWTGWFGYGFGKFYEKGKWKNVTTLEKLDKIAKSKAVKLKIAINNDFGEYEGTAAKAEVYVGMKEVSEKLELRQVDVILEGGGVGGLYQGDDFNYETVASADLVQASTDNRGISHLFLKKEDGVYYYTNLGGSWQGEKVLKLSSMDIVTDMGIAISKDTVHLAFIKDPGQFYYLTRANNKWLSKEYDFQRYKMTALDDGTVNIIGQTQSDIMYLSGRNAELKKYNLNLEPGTRGLVDPVVDEEGYTHTLYIDNKNKELIYLKMNGADIQQEIIYQIPADRNGFISAPLLSTESQQQINNPDAGGFSAEKEGYETKFSVIDAALTLDGNNNVHIAYQFNRQRQSPGARASESSLNYLSNVSGSWKNYFLDAGATMLLYGSDPHIWLDSKGRINIIAERPGNKHVHLVKDTGSWLAKELSYGKKVEYISQYYDADNIIILYRDNYQYSEEEGFYLVVNGIKYRLDSSYSRNAVINLNADKIDVFYTIYNRENLKNVIRHAWRNLDSLPGDSTDGFQKTTVAGDSNISSESEGNTKITSASVQENYTVLKQFGDVMVNNSSIKTDLLQKEDVISSGKDTFLEISNSPGIERPDYISIQLWPESKMKITSEGNVLLQEGLLRVLDKSASGQLDNNFKVETPAANIYNTKADYILYADKDGITMVFMNKGEVKIESKESHDSIILKSGEDVVVMAEDGYISEKELLTDKDKEMFEVDISEL